MNQARQRVLFSQLPIRVDSPETKGPDKGITILGFGLAGVGLIVCVVTLLAALSGHAGSSIGTMIGLGITLFGTRVVLPRAGTYQSPESREVLDANFLLVDDEHKAIKDMQLVGKVEGDDLELSAVALGEDNDDVSTKADTAGYD